MTFISRPIPLLTIGFVEQKHYLYVNISPQIFHSSMTVTINSMQTTHLRRKHFKIAGFSAAEVVASSNLVDPGTWLFFHVTDNINIMYGYHYNMVHLELEHDTVHDIQ